MSDTIAIVILLGLLCILINPEALGSTFAKVRQGFISESVCAAPL